MKLNWISTGSGRMAISHRPKFRAIPYLPQIGCDCVVTLLSEKEGADQIGTLVRKSGIHWIWIELNDGKPPRRFPAKIVEVEEVLRKGRSVLIHCSAGMHRTGMIALALLRRMGLTEEEAMQQIKAMRQETYEALNRSHIEWANSTVEQH